MGYSKIVKLGPGKVKAVHQLDGEGKVYAEDVIIDATNAPEGRIKWLEDADGRMGIFSFSFSPQDDVEGILFPDAKADDFIEAVETAAEPVVE